GSRRNQRGQKRQQQECQGANRQRGHKSRGCVRGSRIRNYGKHGRKASWPHISSPTYYSRARVGPLSLARRLTSTSASSRVRLTRSTSASFRLSSASSFCRRSSEADS